MKIIKQEIQFKECLKQRLEFICEFAKVTPTFINGSISKLKKRFCSGRKAFGIHGANALSKVCVLSEKFNIDELERPIPIDTSVEDWIKEIEENVKINKQHRANRKETEENKEIKNVIVNSKFMKEIMKLKEFSEMRCSF